MNSTIRACLVTMTFVLASAPAILGADHLPIYDIPKIDGITIDGKAEDWAEKGFQINMLANGRGDVKRPEDFAPHFRLGWNDKGLLMLAVVIDEKAIEQRELGTGGDSIQVILSKGRGSSDLIRAVIIPGRDKRREGLRSGFVDPDMSGPASALASDKLSKLKIEATCTSAEGRYTIEALIPWYNLGVNPTEGLELATNIAATDADIDDAFGHPFSVSWYPYLGVTSKVDRAALHRIRLAKAPSSPQETAIRVTCPGRMMSVNVTAAKGLAGKDVTLKRGQSVIAKGKFADGQSCSTVSLVAPISAFEGAIVATVEVEGGPQGSVVLEGEGSKVLSNYILSCDDCMTWDMPRLLAAAQTLDGSSVTEAAARAKLIEYVEKAYFDDAARLHHGELGDMDALIRNLQPDLDAKRAKRWADAVGNALEMKEPVDPNNISYLIQSLAILTDSDVSQCAIDWLAQHGQATSDESIVEMGMWSRSLGSQGSQVLTEMAKRLECFVTAHKALTDADIYRVNAAISALGDAMSPELRQTISGKLTELRPLDDEHLCDLEARPFQQLLDAYVTLKAQDTVTAMLQSQAFMKFSISDQAAFIQAANRLNGIEAIVSGASRVQEQFPTLLAERKFSDAMLTARRLSALLTPQQKAEWAQGIRKTFLIDPKAIAELDNTDFTAAVWCFANLSDTEGLSLMLGDERLATDYSPQQVQSMLELLVHLDKDSRIRLKEIIRSQFENAYLAGNRLEGQDISAVMALGRRLADGLPADRRDAWREQLRFRLIKDGEFIKELAAEDIPLVTGLLVLLGDKNALVLVDDWLEKNRLQVSIGTTTSLFSSTPFSNGSSGKAQLAYHVQQCLMDEAKLASVAIRRTALACALVADSLEADKRSLLADAMMKRYAADKDVIASLSPGELGSMVAAMSSLRRADYAKTLLENNTSWREGGASVLTTLYTAVHSLGKVGLPLEALVCAQFENTYLTGNGFDRADMRAAMSLGRHLGANLPAKRKAAWCEQLKPNIMKDGAFVPNLKADDIPRAAALLMSLDDQDVAAVASSWLDANWQNLSIKTVSRLFLLAGGPGKREMSRQVLRCLLDESKMVGVQSGEAAELVTPLAEFLEGDLKRQLSEVLKKKYVRDAQSTAALDKGELMSMFHAVAKLGDTAYAALLLESNESWRSGTMKDLAAMYTWALGLGNEGLDVRTKICSEFEKTYMSQAPDTLNVVELAKALDDMVKQLPQDQIEVMAGMLEDCYSNKEFLSNLNAPQAAAAIHAAADLKSVEAVRLILTGNANWSNLTPGQTVQVAGDLAAFGEAGVPFQELFIARAQAVLDAIERPSQIPDALKLVKAVNTGMTPERKHELATLLVGRLAKDAKAADKLTESQLIDFATILLKLNAIDEAKDLLSQQRLTKLDMVALARLALIYAPQRGAPIRLALVDHVERTWLLSGKLQQADLPQLSQLTRLFIQNIVPERRKAWADTLRTAMASDNAFAAMDSDVFRALCDILGLLGDPMEPKMFARWMAAGQWKSGGIGKILSLLGMRTDIGTGQGDDLAAIRTLTDHIINEYLTDSYSARTIAPATWRIGIARLSSFMSEDQRRLAGRHFLTAFAGNMDDFAKFIRLVPDVRALAICWQNLGQQDIASVVLDAQRISTGSIYHLREKANADVVCSLVLMQVTAADAEDRKRVWETGRHYFADSIDQFSERTFDILDGAIEAMESDPALAQAIIRDLAGRTADVHNTLPKLEQRFASFALQTNIQDTPPAMQQAFQQAQKLQADGKLAEATASYIAIVQDAGCSNAVRIGLNRRILALLLEQQTDLAMLDKYLPALRSQGEGLDAEAWNLTCRALFRRVAATKDGRTSIWKNGLGDLISSGNIVRGKTFGDLDKLTAFLVKDGDAELAMTIVTDLLLLTPDRYSMRRLQWRRIAAFRENRDWDSAKAAAATDVFMAAASCQNIAPPVEQYMEILRSGGMSEAKVAEEAGSLLRGSDVGAHAQPSRFIDEVLRKSAQNALKNVAGPGNSRGDAYLNFWSGDLEKAVLVTRDRLTSSSSSNEAADILADIYTILASADGDMARANRFADWLSKPSQRGPAATDDKLLAVLTNGNAGQTPATAPADDSKAAAARTFVTQWASAMNLSASTAGGKGNKAIAGYIYSLILRGSTNHNDITAAVDSIIQTQRSQMEDLPDVRAALKAILPVVPKLPHRRIVLMKMAALAHEEQLYDECLSLLDEAGALEGGATERDFAATMLRASSLLNQEDYDSADTLLAEAAKWDGDDENKAQCLFVTACLRLKQGQMGVAGEMLRKITDQYPRTSVATKAKQLATRIK